MRYTLSIRMGIVRRLDSVDLVVEVGSGVDEREREE